MPPAKFPRLAGERPSDAGEAESACRVSAAPGRPASEQARCLAAFACTLRRIAGAVPHSGGTETEATERIDAGQGGPSAWKATVAVELAGARKRMFGAAEDIEASREFNKLRRSRAEAGVGRC